MSKKKTETKGTVKIVYKPRRYIRTALGLTWNEENDWVVEVDKAEEDLIMEFETYPDPNQFEVIREHTEPAD